MASTGGACMSRAKPWCRGSLAEGEKGWGRSPRLSLSRRGYDLIPSLVMPSEPAPSDDPAALQAMLAAQRVENERLRKIIRELQRHRFGRRAESLLPDQLQLGLEEAE